MTSERWYRRAMMPNDALTIFAANAGPQFDADVVEAMLTLFHYGRAQSHLESLRNFAAGDGLAVTPGVT